MLLLKLPVAVRLPKVTHDIGGEAVGVCDAHGVFLHWLDLMTEDTSMRKTTAVNQRMFCEETQLSKRCTRRSEGTLPTIWRASWI